MKFRSSASIFCALLLTTATAFAQDAKRDEAFFPIMGWGGLPESIETAKRLKEAGLNLVGPVSAKELDACQAVGLKALVSDPRITGYALMNGDEAAARKNVEQVVAETGTHPATWGYFIFDEPNASLFPALATATRLMQASAPDKPAFINLLPNYANAQQLGAASYDEYVEAYATQVKPPLLSYDFYGLLENNTLRDGYFQNLESVRRAAIAHKTPFWNVVLGVGHFAYRVPSQADFAFQAYTTLAAGGRGLVYFTFITPATGNYHAAPLDQFGNVTPTYWGCQNVNLQVLKLAPTMLRLKTDDVYHLGEVPKDCHGVTERSLIKSVPGGDFYVGDFTHEDASRYVMIVNKDMFHSHTLFPEYVKPPKKVQLISSITGEATEFAGEQCWLSPGEGKLLKLEFAEAVGK